MKSNLLHICFVLDESGSMYQSTSDVVGGFQRLIDEQKQVEDGECLVSVYRFASEVKKDFIGKPVDEIESLQYLPSGCTAMNDGIGTAITEIGKWLSSMKEDERPSKNMVVIMTDGQENNSKEYTLARVKEMIKHQEEKYNWSFVYMGTDVGSLDDANSLGIQMKSVSGRDKVFDNYTKISCYASSVRLAKSASGEATAASYLNEALNADTAEYLANRT